MNEMFGFEETFSGRDLTIPDDWGGESHPKWEYNDAPPGSIEPQWKRHPPFIQEAIEGLFNTPSPKYI